MNRQQRRKENAQAGRRASKRDFFNFVDWLDGLKGRDTRVFGPDEDTSSYGDGTGVVMPIHMGARGELTTEYAKQCADLWLKITAKHPKAHYVPVILGYDEDPREIWEFGEVRNYVRQWAKFAGITGPEAIKVEAAFLMGLLAACGCEGFEHVQVTGTDGKPLKKTPEQ
jgi:hypothetical protein